MVEWTIEKLIKAELVKLKEEPTVNGIEYHEKVWVLNGCTLNVFHGGYHDFVHYIYETLSGEIKFATARGNECEEKCSTLFRPVMEDKSIDVDELLANQVSWVTQIIKRIKRWITKKHME